MIKLKNVYKVYENGTVAINNMSLEFPSTGLVAITGTSGSGKSTLLNLLSCNDTPTQGKMFYNNKLYNECDRQVLTDDFAYIYQDFKLIENMTVFQNIMVGYELASKDIDKDFVLQLAKKLGLENLLDQKVYSLSGGQQQRVAIARALARKPKVIFADEPTGNLDNMNSINVYNILKNFSDECLVVVVSHDPQISIWANRVISISDGKIVDDKNGENKRDIVFEKSEEDFIDEEVEEIILAQKRKKDKKVNAIFSCKNTKNRGVKKQTLSLKSSLGVSVAFLNKEKLKKVLLVFVMIILISFMTLSSAMAFSTFDKTIANAINKQQGTKFFAVEPVSANNNYNFRSSDMQMFDKYLDESNFNYKEIASGEVLSYNWQNIYASDENVKIPVYFMATNFENMQNAIFVKNPKEFGLEMIKGVAPKYNNEIAISKTFYEYLLHFKNFAIDTQNGVVELKFNENNILNHDQLLETTGISICGVFDDRNSLDQNLKNIDALSLSDAQLEDYSQIVEEEITSNTLINLVLKGEGAEQDWQEFSGVNTDIKISLKGCFGIQNTNNCFDFVPNTQSVLQYFGIKNMFNGVSLGDNEIAIDKNSLDRINAILQSKGLPQVEQGKTLPISVMQMESMMGSQKYPLIELKEITVKIAYVFEEIPNCARTIFANKTTFAKMSVVNKYTTQRLVSAKSVSGSNIAKFNKKFTEYCESNINEEQMGNVKFLVPNCPLHTPEDNTFVSLIQQYASIPLIVITLLLNVGMIVVFYSDFVKTKSKELLILKSLGAKWCDFLKIYGVFSVVITILQLLFGALLGSLLVLLINIFASQSNGFASTFAMFTLDGVAIAFVVSMIVLINIASLAISLVGINNKNLRKSFQKLKK